MRARWLVTVVVACGSEPTHPARSGGGEAPTGPVRFEPYWRAVAVASPDECAYRDLETPKTLADWTALWARCRPGKTEEQELAAYRAFASALADAGHVHECADLLAPVVHTGHTVYDRARYDAVFALAERCTSADVGALAPSPVRCPGADCFRIVPASRTPNGEPICASIERGDARGWHALTANDGPLAEANPCCDVAVVGLVRHAGATLLEVTGNHVPGDCGVATDAFYAIDGDALVLHADRSKPGR